MKKLIKDKNNPTDEQMYSALSFCFMLVIVGIPLWWKTTEVYRVNLPYAEIDLLHKLNIKIQMNIHVITINDAKGEALVKELKNIFRLSKLYKINFKQHNINKPLLGSAKTWEEVEKKIKHPQFEGSLQLFELPGLSRFTPSQIIFGQNRTIYFSSDTDAIKLYNFLTEKILNEDSMLKTTLEMNYPIKSHALKGSMHKIYSANSHDLLFTIVNPEPNILDIIFNITESIEEYVIPFLKELKDISEFHTKSQWLYFVNLQIQPKLLNNSNKGHHFALSEDLLPHVITPLEKKLASHTSENPCLNFVLYVPPCSSSPLHIYSRKGFQLEGANAFISPHWGGIQIFNPDRVSCLNNERIIVKPDKHFIMTAFLQQLRLLLGIPEINESETVEMSSSPVVLRLWEKDSLLRVKVVEQLIYAKLTLQSLSKLLGKINNIVINDQVGEAIYSALEDIYKATHALANGKLLKAYNDSKNAFLSSEKAFTDPSLLALLYFPDDQKYAVYIPLFLPVMIPVLISFKQIKLWACKKLKNDNSM